METFGILVFLGCALICLTLLSLKERKDKIRFLEWRERLIESINHNTESLDEIVKALYYDK